MLLIVETDMSQYDSKKVYLPKYLGAHHQGVFAA